MNNFAHDYCHGTPVIGQKYTADEVISFMGGEILEPSKTDFRGGPMGEYLGGCISDIVTDPYDPFSTSVQYVTVDFYGSSCAHIPPAPSGDFTTATATGKNCTGGGLIRLRNFSFYDPNATEFRTWCDEQVATCCVLTAEKSPNTGSNIVMGYAYGPGSTVTGTAVVGPIPPTAGNPTHAAYMRSGATATATCGSTNGTTVSSMPSANLCSSGTASSVSGSGPWNWTCTSGGASVSCSASTSSTGGSAQCGYANGRDYSSRPQSVGSLCVTGNPSSVTGSGPWNWTCTDGASVANCSSGLCGLSYSWIQSGFGSCSATCGGGTQTQTVTCRRNDGVDVADSYCSGAKPATSQSCNTQACAPVYTYSWLQGGFGSCSATCGGGTQTQTVTCRRNDGVDVADSFCSGAKPATSQSCNPQACAPSLCIYGSSQAVAAISANPLMASGNNGPPHSCTGEGIADCSSEGAFTQDYIVRYGKFGYSEVAFVYNGRLHRLNSGFINGPKAFSSGMSCSTHDGMFVSCGSSQARRTSSYSMNLGGITFTLATSFRADGNAVYGTLTSSAGSLPPRCDSSVTITDQTCIDFFGSQLCAPTNYFRDSTSQCAGYMDTAVSCQ